MILLNGHGPNEASVVVSLCDDSGNWPRPYHEAGHTVVLLDLKHGDDLRDRCTVYRTMVSVSHLGNINGVLMAPVCTDFSRSGAQYWPAKDADGRTAASLDLVDGCLWFKSRCPVIL